MISVALYTLSEQIISERQRKTERQRDSREIKKQRESETKIKREMDKEGE